MSVPKEFPCGHLRFLPTKFRSCPVCKAIGKANSNRKAGIRNVTKRNLADKAAELSGRSQMECLDVIEEVLKWIPEVLAFAASEGAEHAVEIRGFGTFYTKRRKARPARNPLTGNVVALPLRWVLLFRFSHEIRAQIVSPAVEPPDREAA